MKKFYLYFLLSFTFPVPLLAGEHIQCPEKLAIIQDDRIVEATISTFKSLYHQLGCYSEFHELPGRRGIVHFNASIVDGEFYRLAIAETKYSRKFVRSAVPLFQLSNELWLHPDQKVRESLPIGYILGVVWQEEYMNKRNGVSFPNSRKMFESYQRGMISGFLASNNPAIDQTERKRLWPAPVPGEVISSLSLYHYLGSEYAEFMKRLSNLLIKKNPFESISLPEKK